MLWAQWLAIALILLDSMGHAIVLSRPCKAKDAHDSVYSLVGGLVRMLFLFALWALAGGLDKIIGWPL